MKHSWYRDILRRRIFVILLMLIQIAFISYILLFGGTFAKIVSVIFRILGIYLCLVVVYNPNKSLAKTGWIILLLLFPVMGCILYLIFHFQSSTKLFEKNLKKVASIGRKYFLLQTSAMDEAKQSFPQYETMMNYLQNYMGFPVYKNSTVNYYTPGEEFLQDYLQALKDAKKYIFIEYFIIGQGQLWSEIFEILKEKANNGLDVRVMYDDMGCFLTIPKDFKKRLEVNGIKCTVFNPFKPFLSAIQNNRDHRKITSIDGKIAFTGGLNLSDEYMNYKQRFGHWKDCAVKVTGDAAWSFTLMFLEMWQMYNQPTTTVENLFPGQTNGILSDGFVQPYADSPLDNENVGEHVYLQMINGAKKYIWIIPMF